MNSAVQAMMRANGIAPDAKPLASRNTSQMQMAHVRRLYPILRGKRRTDQRAQIEMERYGPGADGAMHRKRLNATSVGVVRRLSSLCSLTRY